MDCVKVQGRFGATDFVGENAFYPKGITTRNRAVLDDALISSAGEMPGQCEGR